MPLYEYNCEICANSFDRLKLVGARDEKTACPDCGGNSLRKLSLFASVSKDSDGNNTMTAGGGCCGGGGGGCACSMPT